MTTSSAIPDQLTDPDVDTFRSAVPPDPISPTARDGRARRLAPLVIAVVGVAVSLWLDRFGLLAVVLFFIVVVPFEKLFPRHGQPLRRPGVGTDVAYAITTVPLGVAGTLVASVIGVLSLARLPGLLLRPVVALLPSVPRMVLGIVLFDIAIYWAHRFAHEVPFLWRFHSIHHSTRHLDWISGFRNHPLDGAFLAPAFFLLIAAGFSPEFSGALAAVQFVIGLFAHANVRWRLRPLHKIVFTPEFHHWHHASEPDAINTNYSVFLPAWDILFGTYSMPSDRRPQVYGVSEPIPSGIARQLWHPFRGLRSPLAVIAHPRRSALDLRAAVRRGLVQMHLSIRRTAPGARSYTP